MRNPDYIAAVRLQGASPLRIVLRHIVPMCLSSLIVRVTLDMAGIILTAAGLGFLGLGAQPLMPEWGAMISTGREQFHLRSMVGRDPSRHRHLRRQPRLQPARRRAARCSWIRGEDARAAMSSRCSTSRTCGSVSDPHRHRGGRARPLLHARPRAARHRRRIRLGQVADRPRHSGADPACMREVDGRPAGLRRHRPARGPPPTQRAASRGKRIAMVLQDPKYLARTR